MASDWQSARDEGARLISEGKWDEAINVLQTATGDDPRGEIHAALGVARVCKEEHGQAAECFRVAVERDSRQQDWLEMLRAAESNATAEINVPVPDVYFHDAEKLLAAPRVAAGTLPGPPPALPRPGFLARMHRFWGRVLGAIASFAMGTATFLWGTLFGYRDRIWTNWYRRKATFAVLTLAYMRDRLNKLNLKITYPAGTLVGFQAAGQQPPVGVSHYRTADGSWNNLADPKEGAAGTRFPRNVSDAVIEPETGDKLMTPNPREISRLLLTRRQPMRQVKFLNMLAACWIQFENHDWVNHGENVPQLHSIPLADDDPFRKRYHQTHIHVGRTQPDPTYKQGRDTTPITFINEVTHWWDGSQIYGSDQATVDRLRSRVDGKLALQADGRLPIGKNGVEDTGFVRNWWVGLTLLHNLFAKEHNSICDRLKQRYAQWDDNRLFNVARLINAAVMAKIHTVEWTPAILPNQVLSTGLHANWYGILTNLLRNDKHRKTVAQINVRNPELGGVVGNTINKHGSAYGLTQEFVEIYRLHSLLPETLHLRRLGDDQHVKEIPLIATRQAGSPKLTEEYRVPDLLASFGVMQPGELVLNNYPAFMQEMSVPGNPLFDLGAVDILRARERGVPRYNEFRRQLGLKPIGQFEDLTDDPAQVQLLKKVYGGQPSDVENLDLMIGTLSEGHRPTGFGFGETMFQIFILNATRRLQADRFFTTCYNEETYTKEGLDWIDDADFRTVLLRNYPELAETGLANIKNAFEPWDPDPTLIADRHPLRAFDRDLQPNPWIGDAHR